jgi:hypothetical protein
VATTHLTYPHSEYDRRVRVSQASRCCQEIAMLIGHTPAVPVVLGGDFNAEDDESIRFLRGQGFRSVFGEVNSGAPFVSHVDHTGMAWGVDHLFFKQAAAVAQADSRAAAAPVRVAASAGGTTAACGAAAEAADAAAVSVQPLVLAPVAATLLPPEVPPMEVLTRPVTQTAADDARDAAAAAAGEPVGRSRSSRPSSPSRQRAAEAGAGVADVAMSDNSGAPSAAPAVPAPPPGAFAQLRPAAQLEWAAYCNLSDHRPLYAVFELR